MENTYNIEVSTITYGSGALYNSFDKNAKVRLPMQVPLAIEALTKKQIPNFKRYILLGVNANTKDGVYCLLPDVKYEIWW